MNAAEFQREMIRLTSTYGEKAYGPERSKMIFNAVQFMSVESFRGVLDELIGSCRQAPMLPEFRAAISAERERLYSIQRREVGPVNAVFELDPSCSYCQDGGVFICRKGNDPAPWAFRCHCPAGQQNPRIRIPHFKQWHTEQGFVYHDQKRTEWPMKKNQQNV